MATPMGEMGRQHLRIDTLPDDTVAPYDAAFQAHAEAWERVAFVDAHAAVLAHVPARPGVVYDIGAGSGRDAAYFAAQGWDVVAVEPADRLRKLGRQLHPSPRIAWESDRLPGLDRLLKRGLLADLIWLSAVWMHVAPGDRRRAFRKLVTLLRPGGRLIMSLRHGPLPFDRPMHVVTADEIERLAVEHGLTVRAAVVSADALGRADVSWTAMVLDLPDDATGALPLLRGVILQDAKSASYKLALLRVIARIADQSASFARYADDHVELPLGLVAVYWLRLFKRLVEQDLPQAPTHRGRAGLGFVKQAFWSMDVASPFELRPGATFAEPRARHIAQAIGDAAYTIARMPAHYLTFADGSPIFPTTYVGRHRHRRSLAITLDAPFFWAFGRTRVPLHVWIALRRLSAWVEPMLLAEWTRLIETFAQRQGRRVSLEAVSAALRWIDPVRDTTMVRRVVAEVLDAGKPIHCVWSGARISDLRQVEIDHCFPFAAWPCDDLWNLMPATRQVNGQKRDRLVTLELLQRSADRIADWWQVGYRDRRHAERALRFEEEAKASLPVEPDRTAGTPFGPGLAFDPSGGFAHQSFIETLSTDSILEAMRFQRLRLRQDQQLPEWDGPAG
jgi:SAM-dependent methyltransferase